MQSLETTPSDSDMTSWKWMRESCQRLLQLLEVAATAASRSGLLAIPAICWKMFFLILIVIFPHNSNKQTETRKLSIFQSGVTVLKHCEPLVKHYETCKTPWTTCKTSWNYRLVAVRCDDIGTWWGNIDVQCADIGTRCGDTDAWRRVSSHCGVGITLQMCNRARLNFIPQSDWRITVLEYFWIKLNCATITNQKKILHNLLNRTWNGQPYLCIGTVAGLTVTVSHSQLSSQCCQIY